jgi:hypothetical protein
MADNHTVKDKTGGKRNRNSMSIVILFLHRIIIERMIKQNLSCIPVKRDESMFSASTALRVTL